MWNNKQILDEVQKHVATYAAGDGVEKAAGKRDNGDSWTTFKGLSGDYLRVIVDDPESVSLRVFLFDKAGCVRSESHFSNVPVRIVARSAAMILLEG